MNLELYYILSVNIDNYWIFYDYNLENNLAELDNHQALYLYMPDESLSSFQNLAFSSFSTSSLSFGGSHPSTKKNKSYSGHRHCSIYD
jgi:hypothetical protein